MPRRIFAAGSVTNATGAPLRLEFYPTSTSIRREADLWTIDSSNNLVERIPNGIVLTDSAGAYSAFAGPDDLDTLYVLPSNTTSRTTISASAGLIVPGDTPGPTWATPAASTTLTGTLAAWVVTAVDCTAGAGARTLPAASSVSSGTAVSAKKADTSTNALVVSRAGSDLIFGTGSGATSKTLSLAGEAVEFVSNGVDKWTVRSSDTPSGVLATTYAPITGSLAYAPIGRTGTAMLSPVVLAGDSVTGNIFGTHFASALGAYPSGFGTDGLNNSNAGVAGNTSAQLLARFATDVIAKAPKLVHILIGTNDAGNSVAVSTFATNVRAMVAQCEAIGARVILGTIPPTASGSPADRKARVVALNQWLCRYALSKGITVADYYRALVDTSTGGYISGYDSGDGIHPTAAGFGVMSGELSACLTRPASAALLLPKDANDPWNYVVNGLFLSSLATGWTQSGSPTGVTTSLTTGDTNIQGSWSKIAAVSSSGAASFLQLRAASQNGTAFVVGNRYCLIARVQSTALSSSQYWDIQNKFVNVQTIYGGSTQNKFCPTLAGGVVVYIEGSAPALTTQNQIMMQLFTGTGDVSVAQIGLYDLTAMGVTDANGVLV